MKVQKQITAINEPFWTADGLANSAQLLVAGQPMQDPSNVVVNAIWQTNWRGAVQLSPYVRTNFLRNTTTVGGTGWSVVSGSGATYTTGQADPAGGHNASLLTAGSGTSYQGVFRQTGGDYAGITGVQFGSWLVVKPGTAQYMGLRNHGLNNNGASKSSYNFVNLATGVVNNSVNAGEVLSATVLANGWLLVNLLSVNGMYAGDNALFDIAITDNTGNPSTATIAGQTMTVFAPMLTEYAQPGVYIANSSTTADATQVDFTYTADQMTFGYVPVPGATFTWSGTAEVYMLTAAATLLAQYANSTGIVTLVDLMNQWFDPTASLDAFYNMIWNVETAQGVGLDIWGAIVDVPRTIQLVPPNTYFGFETTPVVSFYPFNNQPFYAGPVQGTQYTLSDDAYRVLIMTKALANISSFTAPSVNTLLRYLFAGRGSCYVLEVGPMQIEYVFNFSLEPWELSVLAQPQLMPRPAGVGVSIVHS